METTERPAPNAAQPGGRSMTSASPFQSTARDTDGIAGIAAGTVASFSKARTISEKAEAWTKTERHISRATLERLGVLSGTTFFPELDRKSEGLFFQYPDGWKARAFPDKAFVAGKGFKLSFWNIDCVIAAAPSRIYIVEGELDALALVEAGVSADNVLSVPNGAKERPSGAPQDQKGYGYVLDALRAGVNRTKQFVWCGDADGPGLALRADMVRLFGPARFHFVEWPEGSKDANDVLRTDGSEALRSLVEAGSLPWPVAQGYIALPICQNRPR